MEICMPNIKDEFAYCFDDNFVTVIAGWFHESYESFEL